MVDISRWGGGNNSSKREMTETKLISGFHKQTKKGQLKLQLYKSLLNQAIDISSMKSSSEELAWRD